MGKRRKPKPSRPPEPAVATPEPRRFPWRWMALLAVVGLGAVLVYHYWSGHGNEEVDLPEDPAEDPRLTYTGPFRNVHPDVKYVGDAACAGCHREIHKGFRQHAMGRSITPVGKAAPPEKYDPGHHNPFQAAGREFRVDRQEGQIIHKEIFKDAQGKPVVETAVPV